MGGAQAVQQAQFRTAAGPQPGGLQGDKVAILYYKALERRCVLKLLDIICAVNEMDRAELENIRLLIRTYLRADAPIREIV